MTKKINNYEDLLRHEEQLEALLKAQKELLVLDIRQLKEDIKPAKVALSLVSKLTTRDKSNVLLDLGSNKLIDLIVKKVLLRNAGWLTRLAVPFFIKNVSSHVISEHKEEWWKKLFSWIGNKNGNGKTAAKTAEPDTGGYDQ